MKILFLFCTFLLLYGCQKNNDDNGQSQNNDPAKYFFISTLDDNPNIPNSTLTSLNVYNPDLTLKWRKQNMGGGEFSAFLVKDEVVYAALNYNVYALNYSTGSEIWSKLQTQEYIYSMAKKDDTLYCSTDNNTGGAISITAYRASTGALIWRKPLAAAYPAQYLTIDGNTLYYGAAISQIGNYLYAMDLTTQNIKWSAPLGANVGGIYSKTVLTDNRLFLKTAAGKLLAIDKSNGNVVWSKTDLSIDRPVLTANNSIIVSTSSFFGVYGFDVNNGNQLWVQNGPPGAGISAPYISSDGENSYLAGADTSECLIKLNAANGNTIWRQNFRNKFLKYPITVGNRTFLVKINDLNYGYTLISFDASTGAFKDSVKLSYRFTGIPSVISSSGNYVRPY